MYRAPLMMIIPLAALFGILYMPVVASAQNICIAADNECTGANLHKPCLCVVAAGLFTITGVCTHPHECTYTGFIPTGITGTGIAAGAGVGGASLLLTSLFSSSGPSPSSNVEPAIRNTTFTPLNNAGNDRLGALINALPKGGGPINTSAPPVLQTLNARI